MYKVLFKACLNGGIQLKSPLMINTQFNMISLQSGRRNLETPILCTQTHNSNFRIKWNLPINILELR